jgi:hypothetical protein
MIKREDRKVAIIAVFPRWGLRCRANSNDRNKSGSPFIHNTLQLINLYPGIEMAYIQYIRYKDSFYLLYTRGLGIVGLHVMVPEAYDFSLVS